MSLRSDVAAFEERSAALDARLAAVETVLGVPRPQTVALAPTVTAPPAAGTRASAADVAQARTMLGAFTDELGSLEPRVAALADALALFAPATRRAPRAATVPAPAREASSDDVVSRAELDRLQKELVAGEDALAGLELRVGAAEDALDAFFGTVALR